MKILKSLIRNTVGVIFCGVFGLSLPAQTIVTFDVPSATSTEPRFINNSGTVTGYYLDSGSVAHGFIRSASGEITTFDIPGEVGTAPTSINSGGTVAGYSYDYSPDNHGFLRAPDGTITVFDPPGSLNTAITSNINANGGLAGEYATTNGLHGFFRTAAGEYTTMSFLASGVNNADTLTGWVDINSGTGQVEGFVQGASGPFTFFGVPGEAITYPKSINTSGTITGYSEAVGGLQEVGFIRSPSGELTTFQVDGLETSPVSINSSGVVTGYYSPGRTFVGFIRNVAGEIVKFQPSGAVDTMPASINDSGTIVGSFDDTAGAYHGFVWIP